MRPFRAGRSQGPRPGTPRQPAQPWPPGEGRGQFERRGGEGLRVPLRSTRLSPSALVRANAAAHRMLHVLWSMERERSRPPFRANPPLGTPAEGDGLLRGGGVAHHGVGAGPRLQRLRRGPGLAAALDVEVAGGTVAAAVVVDEAVCHGPAQPQARAQVAAHAAARDGGAHRVALSAPRRLHGRPGGVQGARDAARVHRQRRVLVRVDAAPPR